MAFDDRPEIDISSLNDDKAMRAFESCMNQSSGFIPREQVPDKGGDYMVELISSVKTSTNHHFAVQLKSIRKPEFINGGKFISYTFKTSRLSYLLSNVPVYSLIVLYDVSTSVLYYDYADMIYARLMEERLDETWKKQDTVKIQVPVDNLLNEESIARIHETFTKRYDQARKMQQSHGQKYSLPVLKAAFSGDYDLHNIDHVKEILKRLGISFTVLHDMFLLYELISRVPVKEIEVDKDLLIIACVAYGEVGKLTESMFYIEKLFRKFELSEDENSMIRFLKLKNQLNLGQIDTVQFAKQAKGLASGVVGIENKITLRLNLIFFDLLNLRTHDLMPPEFAVELYALATDIDALEKPVPKYQFKVWNAEALAIFINHQRHQTMKELEAKEALRVHIEMSERLQIAEYIIGLHRTFTASIHEVFDFAKKNGDKLIQAIAIEAYVKFHLDWELQKINHRRQPEVDPSEEKGMLHRITLAMLAFHAFQEHNLLQNAYVVLCYQLELLYISRERYDFKDDFDITSLNLTREAMEAELEISAYKLTAPGVIADAKETKQSNGTMDYLRDYTDDQLDYLAEMIFNTGKYPNGKKENMLHELYATRLFYQRCMDSDIDLIIKYPTTDQIAYLDPLNFVLLRKSSGLFSTHSTDMESLLVSWNL